MSLSIVRMPIFWLLNYVLWIQELFKVKDNLQQALGREPTEAELAESTNMSVAQVKRHLEVGRAARNKLIKVSRKLCSLLFMYNTLT